MRSVNPHQLRFHWFSQGQFISESFPILQSDWKIFMINSIYKTQYKYKCEKLSFAKLRHFMTDSAISLNIEKKELADKTFSIVFCLKPVWLWALPHLLKSLFPTSSSANSNLSLSTFRPSLWFSSICKCKLENWFLFLWWNGSGLQLRMNVNWRGCEIICCSLLVDTQFCYIRGPTKQKCSTGQNNECWQPSGRNIPF